jgi:hypothetical protein
MSLYIEIKPLISYLQSIRKLDKYITIDVLFSDKWKLPKTYVDESKVMEQRTDKVNFRLISFISEDDEKKLNDTVEKIVGIINFNLEREEKERLFKVAVNSLKEVFEKQSLTDLKSLTFDIKKEDNIDEYSLDDEQTGETNRLVSEGVTERPE